MLLKARSLAKRYGAITAIETADFTLENGEVHVLIGANGCGKSTLCKIIAGVVSGDEGTLKINDQERRFTDPRQASEAGVGVFYQELSLIPTLSVADNILLGREPRTKFGLVDKKALAARAADLAAPFLPVAGKGFDLDRPVGHLSADQRQIVEILKVQAADPGIVIFDEPTSALDRAQVAVFFDLVRRMKAEGRGIIFISHRMDEIMALGDRVTIMRDGKTIATHQIKDVTVEKIVTDMTGITMSAVHHAPIEASGPTRLALKGVSTGRTRDVSVEIPAGQIIGLGGLHGQGQSDLLRGLFGLLPRQGQVTLSGEDLKVSSPAEAIAAGLAYVSGDRGRVGVLGVRSILENFALGLLGREKPWSHNPSALKSRFLPVTEQLKLRYGGFDAPVSSLSGGNQQKVAIGRWLAAKPRLLLLDDPTKGIDLGAKRDFYDLIRDLCRNQDVAVLLYSSEDDELLSVADRILVFNGGRVVGDLSGSRLDRGHLTAAAFTSGEAA
ncbi:sugar ABC transporter ATP-binding protein [Lacibacterium aquatile]|uniref:Sugar ABC transporter ATP-binding protein n=1 Tax=Lacibacterium aquatile TaxID=1168082 RepID=A0ABW5DMP0_9PROT